MSRISTCPGAAAILGTPTLEIRRCPDCGAEIELFSNEGETACPQCGRVVYSDVQSCVKWCGHAKECVGEEKYNAIAGEKE